MNPFRRHHDCYQFSQSCCQKRGSSNQGYSNSCYCSLYVTIDSSDSSNSSKTIAEISGKRWIKKNFSEILIGMFLQADTLAGNYAKHNSDLTEFTGLNYYFEFNNYSRKLNYFQSYLLSESTILPTKNCLSAKTQNCSRPVFYKLQKMHCSPNNICKPAAAIKKWRRRKEAHAFSQTILWAKAISLAKIVNVYRMPDMAGET